MNGKGVCYHHGGKSPNGLAHPSTTHGRYSSYLPARLADKYLEAANDSDLLNLGSEIALIDTRIAEHVVLIDKGAVGEIWSQMKKATKDLRAAIQAQDTAAVIAAMQALDDLAQRGNADYMGWRDIVGLIEQRRKLVESERKRYVDMQQNITAERAMLLIAAIAGVIKDNVQDRSILAAINTGIGQLITVGASGTVNRD